MKAKNGVFDFITDQNFLNALATMIGPLAFFAAPTEEIEHLLFHADVAVDIEVAAPSSVPVDTGLAKAA